MVFGGDGRVRSFCSRDNCSLVRGFWTGCLPICWCGPYMYSCGWRVGAQVLGLESVVLLEGVGAMGVSGTVVGLEVVVEVLEKLDGTFWCPLKVFWWLILLRFAACLFRL